MCGIVGIIDKKSKDPNELIQKKLWEMLNKVKHRGPDNRAIKVSGNIYLGHARLSILDLNDKSNQPMFYKDYIIVFNGEIYNYLEIKNELINIGHTFLTDGDTEVILHAYEEWGIACQEKFKGMWAFVIYDLKKSLIFGSRDRFGIKPFYYYEDGDFFAFSSEIKPLLTLIKSPQANMKVLSTYLVTNLTNINEETFFEDINQLEGGSYFIFPLNQQLKIERYYDLREKVNSREESSYAEFKETLDESILFHLRSDVKVGTCLSGGVDSSTVAGKVSSLLKNQRLSAVTAKSISPESDESHFAKKVIEKIDNIDWLVVEPDYDFFIKNIEECLYYQEEPVEGPSVFMQYAVMQKAKEAGIKVMMDGQGGDEALLGYERYYTWLLSDLLKRGRIFSFSRQFFQIVKHSKLSFIDLIKQYLYFNKINLRINFLKKRYPTLKSEYMDIAIENIKIINQETQSLLDVQITDIVKTNLPTLLKYEDRNSMLASIEARVPFVDNDLFEVSLNLPVSSKIKNGFTKYSLREYSEDFLPQEISWRKDKKGFEAPVNIWIDNYKETMISQIKESILLKKMFNRQPNLVEIPRKELWKLYNIALWEKQYLS